MTNNQGLLTLTNFERVYKDNLGTIDHSLYKVASVISVNADLQGQAVLSRQNYLARCFDVEPEGRECSSYEYMSAENFPEYEEIQRFISPAKLHSNVSF